MKWILLIRNGTSSTTPWQFSWPQGHQRIMHCDGGTPLRVVRPCKMGTTPNLALDIYKSLVVRLANASSTHSSQWRKSHGRL